MLSPRRERVAVRGTRTTGTGRAGSAREGGLAATGKGEFEDPTRRCAYPSDRLSRPPCYPGTAAAVLRRARGRWRRCSSASSCSARPASMNPVSQSVRRASLLNKKGQGGEDRAALSGTESRTPSVLETAYCIYRIHNEFF